MSSHTVKSLNYQLNNIAECVIEYKENLRKTLVQIKVLKAQAKKAPKDFKYIYRDAIKELDMDVKQHKRNVKEAIKDAKKLRSKLPAAIAYEKKHPEAAGEAGYERERRLHLDKIRGKAVMASRTKALAKRIEKATGIHTFAHTDFGEPYVTIRSTVTYLNRMKREVPELKDAKIEDVYKQDNKMRGTIRLVVK
jgi:hypothetical protein